MEHAVKRGDSWRPREGTGGQWHTVLVAALIALVLVTGVAVVAGARTLDFAPKVGDILVFRPGARMPSDWAFNAVVDSDQLPVSCTLKPTVMASAGGSLVVEQRSKDSRLYRVHWAGQQTNAGDTDCGAAADLLMSINDLQLLLNAVGGPGVERGIFSSYL
jgi:hypothetical protein